MPELNEGGVERGCVELARELVKKGVESVVISKGGKLVEQLEKEGSKHIEVDVCSKNPLSAPLRIYRLREVLKELRADVVHVRSRVPAWMLFFAKRGLDFKVISTVHGFNSVNFYSRIMTKADRVICVSGAIREYIQKHYNTPSGKISVIPRGIDLVRFNPDNLDSSFMVEFKRRFDLEGKFIVSSVGRITGLKDFETFIKSIAKIQKIQDDVVGLVVGGAREDKLEYFDGLKKLAEELNANVKFVGSQTKIAEIYYLSDVVVSSSKKPESFGRSVAEALALGTPVVASEHGGVLDIIRDEENGLFFKMGDAEDLAKKILKASGMRFDGYGYVKDNFSLEQMVNKTLMVYEELA